MAVVPPVPWAVRLPTALLAVANVVLVFLLARRLGTSDLAAIGASVLLTIAPAHVLHGRLGCDYLYPVPCVLMWLILLIDYNRLGTSWRLFAAGGVLGLGLYTYIASLVTMPVLLVLDVPCAASDWYSAVQSVRARRRRVRAAGVAARHLAGCRTLRSTRVSPGAIATQVPTLSTVRWNSFS